jgi:hypothetical protein
MRHDVTHMLLCFASERSKHGKKKRIVQTRPGDKIPYKVNIETRIGRIFRERKPATTFCRDDSQSVFNSVTTE